MDFIKLVVLFCTLGTGINAQEWDPLGQEADYSTVTNSTRTSPMIKKGHTHAVVEDELFDGEAFLIRLEFSISTWFSSEKGVLDLAFPEAYYEDSFFKELAESDEPYQAGKFQLSYLGRKDVKLEDGRIYEGAYILKFHDLKSKIKFVNKDSKLDDPEIIAAVVPGMPVIGAVQIDLKGVYLGYDIVMGADLGPAAENSR